MLKRILIVFIVAVALNLLWEHLHSVFYLSYRGGLITERILFRAALFDATIILLFAYPFLRCGRLVQRRWMLYCALVMFAILLEHWALLTGRWVYADSMPLIPVLKVGISPVIQLTMTGWFSLTSARAVH